MKRLKVALIGSSSSIHIKRWVNDIINEGHEVFLFTNSSARIGACTNIQLPVKSRYGILAYMLSVPKFLFNIIKINPDIIHFHYLGGTIIYGLFLGSKHKIILSPWGSDIYRAKSCFKKFLIKLLMKKSKKVLTTSKSMQEYLFANGFATANKLLHISWGIDTSSFYPLEGNKSIIKNKLGLNENAKIIFSNRTFAELYNTELIIKSFIGLGRKDTVLILVQGSIPNNNTIEYRQKISSDYIKKNESIIILDGIISKECMADYLRAADIVVSIPRSDQRSSSVLEAMACCPNVILSNIEANKELLSEGYKIHLCNQLNTKELGLIFDRILNRDVLCANSDLLNNFRMICKRENSLINRQRIIELYERIFNIE